MLDPLSTKDSLGLARDLVGAAWVMSSWMPPRPWSTSADVCLWPYESPANELPAGRHLLLSELVAEPTDDVQDTNTAVRAVFAWPYRNLPSPSARMFDCSAYIRLSARRRSHASLLHLRRDSGGGQPLAWQCRDL